MRTSVIVFLTLAAVGLVVLGSIVGIGDDGSRGGAGTVTVLGDSLNVGIEPYLDRELDGWTITHDNVVGRRGVDGLAALRELGETTAPVLVISLGTNDPQEDVAGFRRLVEAVVRQAGPRRCVVWSTIWLRGPSEPFNDVLRVAAEQHGTLVIADWASLVRDTPGLLAVDGVHGTPEGYARRAQLVARLVERCRPEPDPAGVS